jgi:hypothetical protein
VYSGRNLKEFTMKVWHFEWGHYDYVCCHETIGDAAHKVAESIIENRRAKHYGNDYYKVREALVSEGVEVKEFQTLCFSCSDTAVLNKDHHDYR